MSPLNVKYRESRDSEAHPNSVPIIIALDVTGSMGHIPEYLIKEKLGTLIETIIAHGVADPAILFCAIGDHRVDQAPLQIGQFESGAIELNNWLSSAWLEGGGGDAPESYGLAHIFAGRYTSTDSFEKRNVKGFLFTVGDERPHHIYEGEYLHKIFGTAFQKGMNVEIKEAIALAQQSYHVFHICLTQISNETIVTDWRTLLGQHVLATSDYKQLAELIATTVAIYNGADITAVTKSFDNETASNVTKALAHLDTSVVKPTNKIIEL